MLIPFPVPIEVLRRRGGVAAEAAAVTTAPSIDASAPAETPDNEKGGADMSGTSTGIMAQTLDGSLVIPATSTQRLALKLMQGEFEVWPITVGDLFAHDLSSTSCALCGGFFPKVGEARGFYAGTVWTYIHVGCLVEAGNWAHPLTPIVKRCCLDGCSRCYGTGDVS